MGAIDFSADTVHDSSFKSGTVAYSISPSYSHTLLATPSCSKSGTVTYSYSPYECVTVTFTVAESSSVLTPKTVAVIVMLAVPTAKPFTTPSASTVATSSLSDE